MLADFFQIGPIPANQLLGTYDLRLVLLSYLVATFASYIALDITGRLRDVGNTRVSKFLWLIGGAVAMGAGIWSMHFIGMLAFSMPNMTMNYDLFWTMISMIVAVFASGFALFLLIKQDINVIRLGLGGVILGLAIASMHYIGMYAMTVSMTIRYLPGLFMLSIVIAIVASEAALWLALKSNQVVLKLRFRLKVISAIIMGAAICGMHYTGMAAAVFTDMDMSIPQQGMIDPPFLAISIAGVTFIILSIAFLVSTYKEAKNQQLLALARQAGMAEVAASVLHNVGNALNSVNVSATLISDKITRSKLNSLADMNALLEEHKHDLSQYLSMDEKGKKIPQYLLMLDASWQEERNGITKEITVLIRSIDHIKNIIAMQQDLSRVSGNEQIVSVNDLLDEAIMITGLDINHAGIDVEKQFGGLNPVYVDKVKLLQIVVNLLRNAKDSLIASAHPFKIIHIKTGVVDKNTCYVEIKDNGVGIQSSNLTRIFAYGFTTKESGHGFGLHSSAIAANELGGAIRVKSEGEGKGATFTLELPYQKNLKSKCTQEKDDKISA